MSIDDDIAFLERVPVLRRLGAPALRILAIGAESYSVQSGEVLFRSGDAADCAFVVQQGSFGVQTDPAGGNEVVAERGALLGEAALLTESRRIGTVVAREDSLVLRISRAMFLKMLESFPEAAQRLRDLMASRADRWAREMENVRATLVRGGEPR